MNNFVYPAFAARDGTPATSHKVTLAMLRNTAIGGNRAVMPRNIQTLGIAAFKKRTDIVPARTTPARRFKSAGGSTRHGREDTRSQ